MSYDYSSQIEHDRLVEELKGYWLSNGWRFETLMNKSTRELLGIRNSMRRREAAAINGPAPVKRKIASKKPVVKQTKYKQITLFNEGD